MGYLITFGIEAAFLIFAASLFASVYFSRKSGAPFFPTPKDTIRTALREAHLAPGEIFYDLGAGDGKALLIAEKEFGARAIGFEISTIFYCIGKINLFFHRSRARLLKQNLFSATLNDADVVFCFLAIRTMQKMEDKIKAELKPGARVIVYAFPLPTMTPIKTITVHGKWKRFIYII
jgi:hypothetical protein